MGISKKILEGIEDWPLHQEDSWRTKELFQLAEWFVLSHQDYSGQTNCKFYGQPFWALVTHNPVGADNCSCMFLATQYSERNPAHTRWDYCIKNGLLLASRIDWDFWLYGYGSWHFVERWCVQDLSLRIRSFETRIRCEFLEASF